MEEAALKARVETAPSGRKTTLDACAHPCAIEQGMRILGGKWTGSILWHLKDGPVRFNDLSRLVSGASKKMIADRLKTLEEQGLVNRNVAAGTPVAVDYRLTELGETALGLLDALRIWSEDLNLGK